MRVLIVKMTSMGDVLHVLPALSDLANDANSPIDLATLKVDWMVEDGFAQIPSWHPLIGTVIPVSTRRWRGVRWQFVKEFFAFLKVLRAQRYDYVIDAQGLIKSAVLCRFARLTPKGVRAGFSGASIKESPAAWFYGQTVEVDRNQHAVDRLRCLVAEVIKYPLESKRGEYKLQLPGSGAQSQSDAPEAAVTEPNKSVFVFHGTTWPTKHVPDLLWRDVIKTVISNGYSVNLCWGNEVERERANFLAQGFSAATVLPKSSLLELANELKQASGAIAVDTGLGHLAAAMDIPCVSLYGATDPLLTGTYGKYQTHLQVEYPCAPCLLKQCTQLEKGEIDPPCYATFNAQMIWHALSQQIRSRQSAIGV